MESAAYTPRDILRYVEENDIKFVRLAFCDVFGSQKNISIMSHGLGKALTDGVLIDASSIHGLTGDACADLLLRPDMATIATLPWRPSHGRVARFWCDLKNPDGSDSVLCCRTLLRGTEREAQTAGVSVTIGAECEFYLFQLGDDGQPTDRPMDSAGYMDIAPADKGENIRRAICLSLEELDIAPVRSHHERGPGQNEIDFEPSTPLCAADHLIALKNAVTTIAAQNGFSATFLPKPISDSYGSGMHITINVNSHAESFAAGILAHIAEMTLFLNQTENSYERLTLNCEQSVIAWSETSRARLMRCTGIGSGNGKIELRSPDPMCNPYLAYHLIVQAGLDGVRRGLSLDSYRYEENGKNTQRLPQNRSEACIITENSEFICKYLPQSLIDEYVRNMV